MVDCKHTTLKWIGSNNICIVYNCAACKDTIPIPKKWFSTLALDQKVLERIQNEIT